MENARISDTAAMDTIHGLLSNPNWNSSTTCQVIGIVEQTGRVIADPDADEDVA